MGDCSTCKSTGRMECPKCKGRGEVVHLLGPNSKCDRCKGDGMVTCTKCSGTGKR